MTWLWILIGVIALVLIVLVVPVKVTATVYLEPQGGKAELKLGLLGGCITKSLLFQINGFRKPAFCILYLKPNGAVKKVAGFGMQKKKKKKKQSLLPLQAIIDIVHVQKIDVKG